MSGPAWALVVVLTLGAIIFILRLVSRQVLKAKYALLWVTIGFGLVVLAAVPSLLDTIADWLGVEDPPNLWLMMGLAFLFVLAVHFSWELSRSEARLRTLAEEIALLRHRLDEHDGTPVPRDQGGDER